MEQLNITVVGAGLIGLSHLERIYQHPECRIGAIVDPFRECKDNSRAIQGPSIHYVSATI
jgi:hypothetical protein